MRNLATVQKITALTPIEGKDRIVLASILGWHVIVNKGEYQVGDLCIYCEIDSLLPQEPEFEFLRARCWNEKYQAFRIKTLKFGPTISQGICFPIDAIRDLWIRKSKDSTITTSVVEGQDVTENLGITKYDPEADDEPKTAQKKRSWIVRFLCRNKWLRDNVFFPPHTKGTWPAWIAKTDETRLQALGQSFLNRLVNTDCVITEKVDGQSVTIGWYKKHMYVCSRNVYLVHETDGNHWHIAKKYDLERKLRALKRNVYIQGEIAGPGIQGNKYKLTEKKLFVFNVYDLDKDEYFDFNEMSIFCDNLGLEMVPVLDAGYTLSEKDTVDSFVRMSNMKSKLYDTLREGIVVRPKNYVKGDGHTGPILGFKVINPQFLLFWDL